MRLYFGNTTANITSFLIILLIAFIICCIYNRGNIQFWGRRTLIVFFLGLVTCCYAATRDGLDKTIQFAIDKSCAPGIFSLVSIPTIAGCIGAAIIIIALILTLFAKSQKSREILFYVISGAISFKILTVEISRIFM